MRAWWRRISPGLYASIIYALVRVIGITLRIKTRGEEFLSANSKGKIVAGWHGRSFLVALHWRNRGYWAMISHSRDGEIMARLFKKLGFNVIRGSSGKGGARAAVETAKALRAGGVLVFTPDGSKGPSKIVQDGLLWLAEKGDAEILPTSTIARPRKLMSSWDKYQIPLPFAKCVIEATAPICVENVERRFAPPGRARTSLCNGQRERAM